MNRTLHLTAPAPFHEKVNVALDLPANLHTGLVGTGHPFMHHDGATSKSHMIYAPGSVFFKDMHNRVYIQSPRGDMTLVDNNGQPYFLKPSKVFVRDSANKPVMVDKLVPTALAFNLAKFNAYMYGNQKLDDVAEADHELVGAALLPKTFSVNKATKQELNRETETLLIAHEKLTIAYNDLMHEHLNAIDRLNTATAQLAIHTKLYVDAEIHPAVPLNKKFAVKDTALETTDYARMFGTGAAHYDEIKSGLLQAMKADDKNFAVGRMAVALTNAKKGADIAAHTSTDIARIVDVQLGIEKMQKELASSFN